MAKRGERNGLGVKPGRRGSAGSRSTVPTGAAVPAAGKTATPLPNASARDDYANFVRQRKDDGAQAIRARRERDFWRAQDIADLRVRRAFERELADHERRIDDFWRAFFRKLPRQRMEPSRVERRVARAVVRRELARSSRKLAAYSSPIIDRGGCRGVYVAVRYLGAGRAAYGCARRLVHYVVAPDHVEHGPDGEALTLSNMGETSTEMASAFALMEDLNRAARANAKVVFHVIVQLPHDVTPEQRLAILRTWCDAEFAARDLPYVAAVHTPSEDGDQRNYHAHIAFSFRPMVRVAPFTWEAGRELRTELDNPQAFRAMRDDYATVMTAVCQIAGKDRTYTGASNAERGLKHKPVEKLGAAKTRLARGGEYVAADARNRRLIARNEATTEADRLKRRQRRLERSLTEVRAARGEVRMPVRRALTRGGTDRARVSTPVARSIVQHRRRKVVAIPTGRSSPTPPDAVCVRAPLDAAVARPPEVMRVSKPERRADPAPAKTDILPLRATPPAPPSHAIADSLTAMHIPSASEYREYVSSPPSAMSVSAVTVAKPNGNVRIGALLSARPAEKDGAPSVVARLAATGRRTVPDRLALEAPKPVRSRPRVQRTPQNSFLVARPVARVAHGHQGRPSYEGATVAQPTARRLRPADERTETATIIAAASRPTAPPAADLVLSPLPDKRSTKARKARRAKLAAERRAREAAAASAADSARLAVAAENERVLADQRRHELIDHLLAAVAAERRFVHGKRGEHKLDAATLARFGLSDSDLTDEPAQRRLVEIAYRQQGEILRIAGYVERHPDQLRASNAGWTLDPAAPADIRHLVELWRGDPTMHAALARTAKKAAPQPVAVATAQSASPIARSAWQLGLAFRQRAWVDWDHRDRPALPQPGSQLPLPGSEPVEAEPTGRPRRDWRSLSGGSGRGE